MRHLFLSLITAILLFSCNNTEELIVINKAQSLLQTRPDSSLYLLKSINPNRIKCQEYKAKYALYLTAALDKNYIDIASDSLIRIAVDYYSTRGDNRDQMMAWYYNGIILKNMNAFPQAVVSFEKAAARANSISDTHYLGLIYRNIASSFYKTNNIHETINYIKRAIEFFEAAPADSAYLYYARYSLAVAYCTNREYDKAASVLEQLLTNNKRSAASRSGALYAKLYIMGLDEYQTGLSLYRSVPPRFYSIGDYKAISLAYSFLNQPDSADIWLNDAYALAKDEADSASIDYTKSKILLLRGENAEAYHLLDHATTIQDSLTRVLLSESVSSAQSDYFREEARIQEKRVSETKRRGLLSSIIGVLVFAMLVSLISFRYWKKDQALKEMMGQLAVNNRNVIQLSQENASLLATHYSERIRHIDSISREYYQADSKDKKDIVFKQFKEYISMLANDSTFYDSLENDLNKYCSGIMSRLRAQVPKIQGNNLKLIALFYAGLSYETVAIITKAQSISSLKTQRSRFRRIIEESSAEDKSFFLEMLEMKRQQARKTNED